MYDALCMTQVPPIVCSTMAEPSQFRPTNSPCRAAGRWRAPAGAPAGARCSAPRRRGWHRGGAALSTEMNTDLVSLTASR